MTTFALPPAESLESVLRRVTLGPPSASAEVPKRGALPGGRLTDAEIQSLTGLRWKKSVRPVLTLDDRDMVYEIIGCCGTMGVAETVAFLQDAIERGAITDKYGAVFETPPMRQQQERFRADIERVRTGIKMLDGAMPCPKCKSTRTMIVQSQTRSADEPVTNFGHCFACGNRWKE